jgi:DNA-binding HxlR family transcriptional regulator
MAFDTVKPPCPKLEKKPGCIQYALSILGDKWSPLLLGQLVSGEKTFGELESGLSGISPRTLSSRIDNLLQEKIIKKNRYHQHPPRYKYSLTDKGNELRIILENMSNWGEKYQ